MKTVVLLAMLASVAPVSAGQLGPDPSNPIYLQDRGAGVSTSMFGTYVRKGELIVYPFYEYYRDDDLGTSLRNTARPGTSTTAGATVLTRVWSLSVTV